MKFLRLLLPFFLASISGIAAVISGTLPVTGPIAPTDTGDTFPSHLALYGKGGLRTVADATARDAIPAARREAGMVVFVTGTKAVYTLNGDLTTWTEQRPRLTVTNYAALASIAAGNLTAGTIAETTGFGTQGDGGEWKYVYDPNSVSTSLPNSSASGGGAWLILGWNGDAKACGVMGDGSNETAKVQAAHDAATARRLPTILPGGRVIKLGSPVTVGSLSHIMGFPGMAYIDGAFSGTKGDANGGLFRTPNALFPTWGEALVVAHTNITFENIGFTRNWFSGGSYTGPLLMIDDAADVAIRNCEFMATNHLDWATFLRGNNIHGRGIKMLVEGALGQDGWHWYGGTNHSLVDFHIRSEDDAVVACTERNQTLENGTFGPGTAISRGSRALMAGQTTHLTTPPSAPTAFVRYITFHDIIAHGGQTNNWPIFVAEFSGANDTHSAEPPRVVSHITFENIITTRGAHQNGGSGALRIEGTDYVSFVNCSFTNGNYSSIALNKTRNTTLKNVRSYRTVRTGAGGGSAGIDGYDKDIYGLTIEGGFFEVSDGLHNFLFRSFTNIIVRGATIAGVSGKYAVWANLGTNFMVAGNTFLGPQAISLGSGVSNPIIGDNLYDAAVLKPITVNGVDRTEGRSGIFGKITESWSSTEKGFELLFQVTAQNVTTLSDAFKLNVDYPSTNAFPLKAPDGAGRWYRLTMTNWDGIPLFMGVYEP